MTINAWAVLSPDGTLLLHSIHPNQRGAWAMLTMHDHPGFPMSEESRKSLGFKAIQVKVKYDEAGK